MRLKRLDYIYVITQFILFFLYALDFNLLDIKINLPLGSKNLFIICVGISVLVLLLAMLQLNQNLSPFPSPKNGGQLIKNGIYKYIRHPIYTGILGVTFGYALYVISVYKLLISIALLVLFYFKSKYEEQRLKLAFKDYDAYKVNTGRFFIKLIK